MRRGLKFLQYRVGGLGHVPVGESSELVHVRGRRPRVRGGGLVPRVAGVVVAVGVELDGEVVGGPAAVDVAAACQAVRFGER